MTRVWLPEFLPEIRGWLSVPQYYIMTNTVPYLVSVVERLQYIVVIIIIIIIIVVFIVIIIVVVVKGGRG